MRVSVWGCGKRKEKGRTKGLCRVEYKDVRVKKKNAKRYEMKKTKGEEVRG